MGKKEGKILGDHKKFGAKFIPPMSQLGITEVSYVNQVFPEIIWMGLLNNREGYPTGIRIVEFMAKKSIEIKDTEKFVNFSLASSYNFLGADKKNQLVADLEKNNYLPALRKSLAPLTCLYEGFPMAFLGPPSDHTSKETMLTIIKECISDCMNKYEQPGMVMQATMMYIRGMKGGLYFSSNMKPPDLDKIITDFDSEEGKKVAASVRAFVLSECRYMEGENSDEWSRSFWNQGYIIDKCNFPWDNDE